MELTHFSLFSGIGGIDLASEWAGFKTVGQCEFAHFPTKVLEKHWPDVPRWKDVRQLSVESIRERGIGEITLLSGGFPCQPHSLAGKRKSSADERDLWPEYRRLIGEIKPRWVLAENVSGLLTSESGQFFRNILRDFAELGYDVGWCTLRASWAGAVHRRERIFVVAHANGIRLQGGVHQAWEKQKISNNLNEKHFSHLLERISENELSKSCSVGANDGIPNLLDRIKCLGNSVVPQEIYIIVKVIYDLEQFTNPIGE